MIYTEEMQNERERHKQINRLLICRASYSSGVPNGVEFAECRDESLKPCSSCPVMIEWRKVLDAYIEQGLEKTEAIWLTHQFFDIPTAYMCNGQIRESEKRYFPARYEKALARQAELIDGKIRHEEPPKVKEDSSKQMSIFDFMSEGGKI